MKKIINFYGTGGQGQGYSGAIEQTMIALNNHPDFDVRPITFTKTPDKNISEPFRAIKEKEFILSDISIVYGFPQAFDSSMSTGLRIGYTMFETDTLPTGAEWAGKYKDPARMINEYCDVLVVPCTHNVDVFRKAGVTVPIEVVPCGINSKLYPPAKRERIEGDKFTFFMHGTLTLRKNVGMVISAFANLFKNNDDVQLILKTQSGTLGHIEYVDMGNIVVIDELWEHERLYQAMADADCYVFPSRGEGFGLPPLEAMATGLPTIIADNTGMSDYADSFYNLAVPTVKITPAQRYPKKWGNVGNWYEPDYYVLKEYMKWVYENQGEAIALGRDASEWVHRNWSYDNTAEKLADVIKKYYNK